MRAIIAFLALSTLPFGNCHMGPVMPPFFFLCHYHSASEQHADRESGEVALSVAIEDRPSHYEPGKLYKVTVSSTSDFDGFMMTGLYTLPENVTERLLTDHSPRSRSVNSWSHNVMCAVVHSQMSYKPMKSLSFLWIAPPAGTGCVDFLATGSLGQRVIFKDVLAFQICEKGTKTASVSMAAVNRDGVVLRDDFEGSFHDSKVWTEFQGGDFGSECGSILSGKAAAFCAQGLPRYLISVPFNVTSRGSVLQFVLSSGKCNDSSRDPPLRLMLAKNSCQNWAHFETIELPASGERAVRIAHLPAPTTHEGTMCLKFFQQLPEDGSEFGGCWAIDNVLVVHTGDNPRFLYDDFYPNELGNWLFLPGAEIKKSCFSKGSALVFRGQSPEKNFATTRDLNLTVTRDEQRLDIILEEEFDDVLPPTRWIISSANRSDDCGAVSIKKAVVFATHGVRMLCTRFVDEGDSIGNLRFHFVTGNVACGKGKFHGEDLYVAVYAEETSGQIFQLDEIRGSKMKTDVPVEVSIAILPGLLRSKVRFCWKQDEPQNEGENVWAVDGIRILPWMPSRVSHVIQFSINLHCGGVVPNNSVSVEFSNDHGLRWTNAAPEPCLPPSCSGKGPTVIKSWWSSSSAGWERVTLPLPYAARGSSTRFRFRQENDEAESNWAIDSVYIGYCQFGCSGHGLCSSDGCSCDFGFSGQHCERAPKQPSHFTETFPSEESVLRNRNFLGISGAVLGYQCGVLGRGRALVFNGAPRREAVTRDLNTMRGKFLEMSLRVGSSSAVNECPSPEAPSLGNVYVHYSCDGGIVWFLLHGFEAALYSEPTRVTLNVPGDAQGLSCRLRVWQPSHSGHGRDVWAVDDVALGLTPSNSISVDFEDDERTRKMVSSYLGRGASYCGAAKAFVFSDGLPNEASRFVETRAVPVGPQTMAQFELAINCDASDGTLDRHFDSQVMLEYSTDHGVEWRPVRKPCSVAAAPECGGSSSKGTAYDTSEYPRWRRVTILLPRNTWSDATRLRLVQRRFLASDSWAVDNIYVGPSCANLCSGHGRCYDGKCVCDAGFLGTSCVPKEKMPTRLRSDFDASSAEELRGYGYEVDGGQLVDGGEGCGTISSGRSLYFNKSGTRQLVTPEMDTSGADAVRFFVRIGGGSPILCRKSSNRSESVLVQYSKNSGVDWHLMKELSHDRHRTPRFVSVPLPEEAKSERTRIRWWQPQHDGEGHNQWALDDVLVSKEPIPTSLRTDSANMTALATIFPFHSKMRIEKYCESEDEVLVFQSEDEEAANFAMTAEASLSEGDVVQFKVAVGCEGRDSAAVRVEYSKDSGDTWSLIRSACFPASERPECESKRHDASVRRSTLRPRWTNVAYKVGKEAVATGKLTIRWLQEGRGGKAFALKDVYIGKQCRNLCFGNGVCASGVCKCDRGFEGQSCETGPGAPKAMMDRFEDEKPSQFWEMVSGGAIGKGCGVVSTGKSLYFSGVGPRLARTVALDTRNIKCVEFVLRLGEPSDSPFAESCRPPSNRNGSVVFQYTATNGLIWHLLTEMATSGPVRVNLPTDAKARRVAFRWWQPDDLGEWALDDVFVAANDTNDVVFEDRFASLRMANWYSVANARPTAYPAVNALLFSGSEDAATRYAETWDLATSSSSFVQFDLNTALGRQEQAFAVVLQYSLDSGTTWAPLVEECLPPDVGCHGYAESSVFDSDSYSNWTRITMGFPPRAISRNVRFRWTQQSDSLSSEAWALAGVYVGQGCPWLCSGHGHCKSGKCHCDEGYGPPYCTAIVSLPRHLRETFDTVHLNAVRWPKVFGGEVGHRCSRVVNGMAFTFHTNGTRMLTSQDLDLSNARFLEFTIKMGCASKRATFDPESSVVVQYSNNGGITWKTLKEIPYLTKYHDPYKVNVLLQDAQVKTNSTRLRFWQPRHGGAGDAEWALDSVYVGGMSAYPNVLHDTFESEMRTESYIDWPGGRVGYFCNRSGLVFDSGEDVTRALYTLDVQISSDTIVQFDLKVGCGGGGGGGGEDEDERSSGYPVLLEYSANEGITWNLVRGYGGKDNGPNPDPTFEEDEPTVYFDVGGFEWLSLAIPLRDLHVCGHVRFRWRQLNADGNEAPGFALSNVYVGPACPNECTGQLSRCHVELQRSHGCEPHDTGNATAFISNFEGDARDFAVWHRAIGGEVSRKCGGVLASGSSLVFARRGHRVLVTKHLDLSFASSLQFYLRLGCGGPNEALSRADAVLLQFSKDDGVSWRTIEKFPFGESKSGLTTYVAIEVPDVVKGPSVQLRWWQPSSWGEFAADWAIDQIHVGSDGNDMLSDDFDHDSLQNAWIDVSSGITKPVCGLKDHFLHFSAEAGERYAVTADVTVDDRSYVQFDLVMGCERSSSYYSVELQFSTDMGKSWTRVIEPCLPPDVSCSRNYGSGSVYAADEYYGVNRIGFNLPYYTWSKATRFRWIQLSPYATSDNWSLGKVYIGDRCSVSCSAHGHCNANGCSCDDGWHGDDCSVPKSPLPSFFTESFSDEGEGLRRKTVGAFVSDLCGRVGYGTALHFYGQHSRVLETKELDLRNGTFVSFYFKSGCLNAASGLDSDNVFLQVFAEAASGWVTLKEIDSKGNRAATLIVVNLPKSAKVNGARFRWWQPSRGQGRGDWAVDEIVLGSASRTSGWLREQNATSGRDGQLIAGPAVSQDAVLETVDVRLQNEDILQFAMEASGSATIDLQFSTDFGFSWNHVVGPLYPEAFRSTFTPTRFYPPFSARRFLFPLSQIPASEWTRFRWIQYQSPSSGSWTIDEFYAGPTCPRMCSFRGYCSDSGSRCDCDRGFHGTFCQDTHEQKLNPTYLKEPFERSFDEAKLSVTGGRVGVPCLPMKANTALVFDKKGAKSLETVDLDLSDAKFIQYVALIGGKSGLPACKPAASKHENVFLEFSLDSGMSWESIYELGFESYRVPRFDYILLPAKCRTSSTRFRWRQMDPDFQPEGPAATGSVESASWALDDIFIGGQEINDDRIVTDADASWWFHPYGEMRNNYCGKAGNSMVWNGSLTNANERSLTTREVIVGEGYILQFKLAIGCDAVIKSCNNVASVRLEYSTDPASETWHLVKPPCYPGIGSRTGCSPNVLDAASVYGQDAFHEWTRVVIPLPARTFSGNTQFRWLQSKTATSSWAVSDVYVGPSCPDACNGFGDCVRGRCVCDSSRKGERCEAAVKLDLEEDDGDEPAKLSDDFEGEKAGFWSGIFGGTPSKSCGSAAPDGHGLHLRFDTCGVRMAVTDPEVISRVSFVMRIGCGSDATSSALADNTKLVLLQYSEDNGIRWKLIAGHHPKDYLLARRVQYELPRSGRRIRLRWWQPNHDGPGRDQWALDNVEIFK